MKKGTSGEIRYNKVQPSEHEQMTLDVLKNNGWKMDLVPISKVPGVKTPDFMCNGLPWEMKTFSRVHWRTIERSFHNAMKQAPNVIFDLRSVKADQEKSAIKMILKAFNNSKAAKRLVIVRKNASLEQHSK